MEVVSRDMERLGVDWLVKYCAVKQHIRLLEAREKAILSEL